MSLYKSFILVLNFNWTPLFWLNYNYLNTAIIVTVLIQMNSNIAASLITLILGVGGGKRDREREIPYLSDILNQQNLKNKTNLEVKYLLAI